MQETHEIRVRGAVQGVGFRPTIFRLATRDNLVGEVLNDAEGVLIRVSGHRVKLLNFVQQLDHELPPLAKIDSIESKTLEGDWNFKDFSIRQSEKGHVATEVSADAAICSACLQELFNPDEPRYLYPFTNCTHCGPRVSIVTGIPYDRENSTMAPFPMCDRCKAEYTNPLDRRFHAQPVACFDCGPQVHLEINVNHTPHEKGSINAKRELSVSSLKLINDAIGEGKIVAIRGIGGFHLCCDAASHSAVKALRLRKQRYAKPFALMTHDLALIKGYCELSDLEKEQLLSSSAPIVLLKRKALPKHDLADLSAEIAPGSDLYGFMMPYTPLHWLVCKNFGKPLVMTSGNLSNEPQIIDNQEARQQLDGIADLILYHNRDIANRIDDSVVRCMAGKARVMRRARGYAPRSFMLPPGFAQCPEILACGAELKSTFCLVKNGTALVSQHQGDLEDIRTFDDYAKNLDLYQQLYGASPAVIVIDKHPEYVSTKFARNDLLNKYDKTALIEVQHHHAHVASCLAENQLPVDTPPVLGIVLDGLGFGDDGTFWGGEFLLADYNGYQRVGRFKSIAMPGGTQAIKEPWRNTYAHILNAMPWSQFHRLFSELELCQFLQEKPLSILEQMLNKGINSPPASSCGRLFDAVSAAVGLCREHANYEGQGAIELEMQVHDNLTAPAASTNIYDFDINTIHGESDLSDIFEIDSAPMWHSLLNDMQNDASVSVIATRFHAGLINSIGEMIDKIQQQHEIMKVALSGGCLQNKVLLEGLTLHIQGAGLECLTHSQFPCNDGGISLGQAAIAAARTISKKNTGSQHGNVAAD